MTTLHGRPILVTALRHLNTETWALSAMLSSPSIETSSLGPRTISSRSSIAPLTRAGGRGAIRAVASILWKPNHVYLAVVNSSFRWDSHQGHGRSYPFHPVGVLCCRRTSRWTRVKRAACCLAVQKVSLQVQALAPAGPRLLSTNAQWVPPTPPVPERERERDLATLCKGPSRTD
jgi:hypothetical protein